MANLVVVAIPRDDDYVWKISSEKKPHMTLLFLGDAMSNPNVLKITEFVEHAVNTSKLAPFGLEVDHRDVLGEDKADVLFFNKKGWSLPQVAQFRGWLLKNNAVRKAYDSVEQFPEWNPHLTLGYPGAPARADTRDYPGISWVEFDRIALWFGDFEGPEFRLEHNYYDYNLAEVGMSTTTEVGEEFISHFGVAGMKWGVRNARGSLERRQATVETKNREKRPAQATRSADSIGSSSRKKTTIKARGGQDHPATEDAIRVAEARQKIKKSGFHAVSNKELQDVASRLNLEMQVRALEGKRPKSLGQKVVGQLLRDAQKDPEKALGVAKKLKTGLKIGAVAAL